MRVSERTRLGLRALVRLAGHDGAGSLSASQIAKKEGVTAEGLAQVLNALKRSGLVKSVRGPQGGYVLARKPAEMALWDVFRRLDGRPEDWISDIGAAPSEPDETDLASAGFWRALAGGLEKALSSATLKDLVDEARRAKKSKNRSAYTFHI